MIMAGILAGERPRAWHWLGLLLAFVGLVLLTRPGLDAPPLLGSALMLAAGVAWGVYSLHGRRSRDPLAATAGNFVRAGVLAAALAIVVRSDARRVGQKCVRTCRLAWSPSHQKKKKS